jgi:sugar phosphate isomerase/epimerase
MTDSLNRYPRLTKSFKGKYPFKIGTTSFIYPDYFIPNVRMLGPYLDEIELLLFESDSVASLLSKSVISDLIQLSENFNLTYNIHLPTDISISDPDPKKQQRAVDILIRVIDQTADLLPSTCTLHVPYTNLSFEDNKVRRWQNLVCNHLGKILAKGIPPEKLALETLDYPIDILSKIIEKLNLALCLDIGHLIVHGYDIQSIFNNYAELISIIHLHGVDHCRDHLALDQLPERLLRTVIWILKNFKGTVSLEVFCFQHLDTSLRFLDLCWNNDKEDIRII